jgi:maltose alpha-D-glucosyltransferase/alpha-amylase
MHEDDPMWYKDAIIYEMHVRAFHDSDGNGIGDFRGLIEKLDYLQDLGVTAIWLLPFYPSPLRDDGYDISDYTDINPMYGSMRDFRQFVREAHKRGLRVITELVCNHTSDQHPWFQRARHAKPGSSMRDFYVWSDTDKKYSDTRIIFQDFESSNWTWDPVANAYYWHRFYRHQPDLNFENPRVQAAVLKAMDFWLKLGVDGLRLDAIPYLYEREGTNCENLPETHQFLKELRAHIDERFQDKMLLAEANQWPEDAVTYFGDGDECHMSFHFPLMPRLFMSLYMENRFPIIDILAQTPSIPETAQWALFLRNHDELTLEMVTDEERDYMYRIYANDPNARINLGIRRRLAPLLSNNRRRIELMNGLLFSLPGTPVIYYGDEIGMGDNIYLGDRDGVRTPMQWSPDRNAGFSRANRQRLYLPVITDPEYHYEAINVATQQGNPSSLLWWMKRLIALRKRYKSFGRGSMEFLHPDNRKVLAFIRSYENETILVVANLSRFSQGVELDLSKYRDMVPMEMFGRTAFPPIGELPYFVTLGPHSFFFFSIEPMYAESSTGDKELHAERPSIKVTGTWETLFRAPKGKPAHQTLANALPKAMLNYRWFGGKARTIRKTAIRDCIPVAFNSSRAYIVLLQVDYTEGDSETYVMPIAYASGEQATQTQEWTPQACIATLKSKDGEGLLYDALYNPDFGRALLLFIANQRRVEGESGHMRATATAIFREMQRSGEDLPEPKVSRAEQSNTSLIFGDQLIIKLFRRVDEGVNPDLEIGRFLTEKTSFTQIAPVAGSIEYGVKRAEPMSLFIAQRFVPNEGDAWQYTLDALGSYFEWVATNYDWDSDTIPLSTEPILTRAQEEVPELARQTIGAHLEAVALLGKRTAEMHRALCSEPGDPAFRPEPFTSLYQRSVYQSMRTRTRETFLMMQKGIDTLPEASVEEARELLQYEDTLIERLQSGLMRKLTMMRTRCHGDYHLGQVLHTGDDFVIIDFEGEPARTLRERKMKRSPLLDVAGMLRSFQYAAATGLERYCETLDIHREQNLSWLADWSQFWYQWVAATFLRSYLEAARDTPFIPEDIRDLEGILEAYMFDKAVYELGYEMNNRPHWVHIPIRSLLQMLKAGSGGPTGTGSSEKS